MGNEKLLDNVSGCCCSNQSIVDSSINNINDLVDAMNKNCHEVQALYEKAIELNCQNEQFFMNWQDKLNDVSCVHISDL